MERYKVFQDVSLQNRRVTSIEGAPSIGQPYESQRELFLNRWKDYRERVQRGETSDADEHCRRFAATLQATHTNAFEISIIGSGPKAKRAPRSARKKIQNPTPFVSEVEVGPSFLEPLADQQLFQSVCSSLAKDPGV